APVPRVDVLETQLTSEDFTLGGESAPAEAPTSSAAEPASVEPAETMPDPPELPDFDTLAPLPDVPDPLPAPAPSPPALRPVARAAVSESRPRAVTRNSGGARAIAPGRAGGAEGMSSSARLAAGRMPPPAYPAEARRLGQTGTLVVEFTVDATGRVISAYAKSPSPWALLNQEAVRTVRGWKFPPGAVMTLQRPIVFQLR
ncbi:MAG: hypothetical protein RLZZ282_32, partial [Verrucomicrobiota bacterium]